MCIDNISKLCNIQKISSLPFRCRHSTSQNQIFKSERPKPILHNVKIRTKTSNDEYCVDDKFYEKTNWIAGCSTSQKIYCWPCLLFHGPESDKSTAEFNDSSVSLYMQERINSHREKHHHIEALLFYIDFDKKQNSKVNVTGKLSEKKDDTNVECVTIDEDSIDSVNSVKSDVEKNSQSGIVKCLDNILTTQEKPKSEEENFIVQSNIKSSSSTTSSTPDIRNIPTSNHVEGTHIRVPSNKTEKLIQNKTIHTNTLIPTHKCTPCNLAFPTITYLNAHNLFAHSKEKIEKKRVRTGNVRNNSKYDCISCGKHNANADNLSTHIKNVHFGSDPRVIKKTIDVNTYVVECSICTLTFTNPHILIKHYKRVHNKKMPITCKYCEVKFSEFTKYSNHCRSEHGTLSYSCNLCTYCFEGIGKLIMHYEAMHTVEYKFECPICYKKFGKEKFLETHIAGHEALIDVEYSEHTGEVETERTLQKIHERQWSTELNTIIAKVARIDVKLLINKNEIYTFKSDVEEIEIENNKATTAVAGCSKEQTIDDFSGNNCSKTKESEEYEILQCERDSTSSMTLDLKVNTIDDNAHRVVKVECTTLTGSSRNQDNSVHCHQNINLKNEMVVAAIIKPCSVMLNKEEVTKYFTTKIKEEPLTPDVATPSLQEQTIDDQQKNQEELLMPNVETQSQIKQKLCEPDAKDQAVNIAESIPAVSSIPEHTYWTVNNTAEMVETQEDTSKAREPDWDTVEMREVTEGTAEILEAGRESLSKETELQTATPVEVPAAAAADVCIIENRSLNLFSEESEVICLSSDEEEVAETVRAVANILPNSPTKPVETVIRKRKLVNDKDNLISYKVCINSSNVLSLIPIDSNASTTSKNEMSKTNHQTSSVATTSNSSPMLSSLFSSTPKISKVFYLSPKPQLLPPSNPVHISSIPNSDLKISSVTSLSTSTSSTKIIPPQSPQLSTSTTMINNPRTIIILHKNVRKPSQVINTESNEVQPFPSVFLPTDSDNCENVEQNLSVHEPQASVVPVIDTLDTPNIYGVNKIVTASKQSSVLQMHCSKCSNAFVNQRDFGLHMNMHSNIPDLYKNKFCDCCNQNYTNYCSFTLHKTVIHNKTMYTSSPITKLEGGVVVYKCSVCLAGFTDRQLFYAHCNPYVDYLYLVLYCDTCNLRFSKTFHFIQHSQLIHNTIHCFKCDLCVLKFESFYLLRHHVLAKHNGEYIFCRNCNCDIGVPEFTASHVKTCMTYNSNTTVQCQCPFCDKQNTCNSYENHVLNHFEGQVRITCRKCLNVFFSPSNFKYHKNWFHPFDYVETSDHYILVMKNEKLINILSNIVTSNFLTKSLRTVSNNSNYTQSSVQEIDTTTTSIPPVIPHAKLLKISHPMLQPVPNVEQNFTNVSNVNTTNLENTITILNPQPPINAAPSHTHHAANHSSSTTDVLPVTFDTQSQSKVGPLATTSTNNYIDFQTHNNSNLDFNSPVLENFTNIRSLNESNDSKVIAKCKICRERIESSQISSLEAHMAKHRLKDIFDIPCLYCGLNFVNVDHLERHIEILHKTCKLCHINFDSTEEFNKHKKEHKLGMFAIFLCLCGEEFNNLPNFVIHYKETHTSSELDPTTCVKIPQSSINCNYTSPGYSFACIYCNKAIDSFVQLNHHLKQIHGVYQCQKCLKYVTTKYWTIWGNSFVALDTGKPINISCMHCGALLPSVTSDKQKNTEHYYDYDYEKSITE